jgi:hypothetical protein
VSTARRAEPAPFEASSTRSERPDPRFGGTTRALAGSTGTGDDRAVSHPSEPPEDPVSPSSAPPGAPPPEDPPGRPLSSVERVAARESFSEDEPLPAFTFPVLDEATKQEVLRRVDQARAEKGQAPLPPPAAAPDPAAETAPVAEAPAAPEDPDAASDASADAPVAEAPAPAAEAPLAAPAMPAVPATRAPDRARAWIDASCAAVDQSRARLPKALRRALDPVSSGVILSGLAGLAVVILLVGGLWLVGGGSDESVDPEQSAEAELPPEDPVPAELDRAKQEGHAALEALAERYPKDARVWLAIAGSRAAKDEFGASVEAVGKALAADPGASTDATASEVLGVAARKRGTTDAALTLLEGPMGEAGATVVYDLSIDPKAELPLRKRAEEWVRSEAFEKVAAPDVALAGALRYARSCADRHALLPRAAEQGGERTLDFLHVARTPAGCGSNARKDCYPCLRKDTALKDAIAAIEKRVGG